MELGFFHISCEQISYIVCYLHVFFIVIDFRFLGKVACDESLTHTKKRPCHSDDAAFFVNIHMSDEYY